MKKVIDPIAQMKAIIHPSSIEGKVKAIASKSHAHRILICAAFSDRDTYIVCEEASADIMATVSCLESIGVGIEKKDDGFLVHPIDINNTISDVDGEISIDCNESGSTLRFLLPIVCLFDNTIKIYSRGRLPKRPLSPLYEELLEHGAIISKQGEVPLIVRGKITSGKYTLPANISSQYISGLLFALPILDGDSEIILTEKIESKSYIDMTVDVLKMFNIDIIWNDNRIYIKGNQQYKSPGKIVVEGDWSNIAFWLCAGAISDQYLECTNLNFQSLQGDKEIIDILRRFGADIVINEIDGIKSSIRIRQSCRKGSDIDANNIPDLVPILALVASVSEGTTKIYNASRLRLKERDRIESVVSTLNKLGADIYETEDGMIIEGRDRLHGGEVDSYNDHRIAMMAAIASLVSEKDVIITDACAVNKSYSSFYNDYIELGGNIEFV